MRSELWCGSVGARSQNDAHHFHAVVRNFENNISLVCKTALKIRVSVVRFRPRPPYTNARLLSVGRFHLGFPQYTRGTGSFCVCQGLVDTVSTVASSTLFCPLFSEKKHQLLRLGTRTSPCETRTYACVDFSSSPEHLEGRYLAVRSLEVKLQIEWQSARQK